MHRFHLSNLRIRSSRPLRLCATVVAALWLSFALSIAAFSGMAAAKTIPSAQQASITLDGVSLSIRSNFLPSSFVTSPAENMAQMASAVAQRPYREFQIEAIPFNTSSSLESLPAAKSGEAQAYRSILHTFRAEHGAQTIAHPTLNIFGQQVIGEANLLQLRLDSTHIQQAVITEYVVEAGARLWLIRLTQELTSVPHTALAAVALPFLNTLASVTISSSTLNRPSAHVAALLQEQKEPDTSATSTAFFSPLTGSQVSSSTQNNFALHLASLFQNPTNVAPQANLPSPKWWSGVCDYNNYLKATGWESWKMNNGLRGVYPCGPRPGDGGPDHLVRFYSGAWGEYEWECVELSMRWMYLAYDVHPYGANGNGVVSNYTSSDGGNMVHRTNSTDCCIVPEPGDVLSYCSTCTYGHTSVVLSTSVNSSGNGSITIMEQNVVHDGKETLTVSNWEVTNTPEGWVYGYLHHK